MKFYQYINEKNTSRVKTISEQDAKDFIKNNCEKSLKNTFMWRGTPTFADDYGFGDSKNTTKLRKSRNTRNYYTLLIDNSPPWLKFPKRSKSFICTTDENLPPAYGNTYRIIPFDDTVIGVCPSGDIWASFKDFESMEFFNHFLVFWAKKAQMDIQKMEDDYNYLIKALSEIGVAIKEANVDPTKQHETQKKIIKNFLNSGKSFDEFIIKILAPKYNNFTLTKAGNKLPEKREVWFQGKGVLLDPYAEKII